MIQIGNVCIYGNVALSPMAGISDSPYRQITRKLGSAFSYSEFVSTEQIVQGNQRSIDMFRFKEMERPIFFQIFGSEADTVIEAAKIIETLQPDVIDLNMGCSVSKVAHHGSGAGLLKNLKVASHMIEGMRKSLSVPVTAKIRIGWDENNLNYKETVHVLQESGVQAISVHGRTKAMAYTGRANWDVIGEIKSLAKVPIFGNGDVSTYQEALSLQDRYKVDLVLIGRKAIGNPWVFHNFSKSNQDRREIFRTMKEHLESMLDFYRSEDEYALILFRKHFVKYLDSLSFPTDLKTKMLQMTSVNEFLENLYFGLLHPDERQGELKTESLSLNCESYV
ncbi:tRNA-dihydrouridine synthase [Leptospira ryugenii]|uniref:tRNA-dihydrouridine synthase n=1 Tax=Leptospira ryugenii TaxID=1917863 RepID=A0A2P2E362_9LEPT|nr:tRNA-dihydrouridine synthase [Leptospira ryugenii]GBF51328.1 tRNA-dihydrouridine synthase [Leptospira ryugenii]